MILREYYNPGRTVQNQKDNDSDMGPLQIVGIIVVVLMVVGGGGYKFYKWRKSRQ